MAETLRFDFASTGAGSLQRDLRGVGDNAALAAKGARLLSDALDSQRKSAVTSAGASISLAKADKILADAEHALSDEALAADFALRREAEAAKKSGRAATEAAAENSRLADALRKVGDSAVFRPSGLGIAGALSPALIPLAGGIAAGIGAIGISFGAATIGAGAFGLAARSVLSSASTDLAKLQAANARVLAASTPAARKSAQAAVAALKATFAPGYLALIGQLETFKNQWKKVSQSIAVPALSAWLPALTKGLQFLKPALIPVANVFAAWGQALNKYFSNPAAANTIKSAAAAFGQFSAIQLGNIGQFIGEIGKGIFNLGKDLFSSGFNFSAAGGWLQNIGAGFLTWSRSAKARADVQGFLRYLHTEGPVVSGILSDLGKILPGIFQGASAVGQLELKAIAFFLGEIAKLPRNWQAPLTEAAGALLLLSKTGVIKIGFTVAGAAVSLVKKLLGGGSVELGGAAAAGEIEAAFRTGGAAAAAEIRAAMTAGAAAAGGEAAAGAAAGAGEAAAGGGLFTKLFGGAAAARIAGLAGGISFAGAALAAAAAYFSTHFHIGQKTLWQLGNPPPPGQRQTWYNSWSGFGKGIVSAFGKAAHATASGFFPGGLAQDLLQPGKTRTAIAQVSGDLIHTAGPAINSFRGAMESAATAIQKDFRPQLARLHADSPAVKQDMDKLAASIQATGTKSAESRSARQEMIHDLEQSGVKASIARGLVNNYITRLQAIPAHVSTQIRAFGSGSGRITFKDQIAGQNAQGFLEFHAKGGQIKGGTPGRDSVLSALTPGEVVVPQPMVAAGAVDHLRGRLPGFAAGGLVGGAGSPLTAGIPFEAHKEQSFYHRAFTDAFTSAKDAFRALARRFASLGGGGAGVQRWANTAAQAMHLLGIPLSDLGIVLSQMASESGGDPTIVNRTDSNWLAGHPSVGLMQVIAGTFDTYAGPFRNVGPFEYGVSVNPLANIYAGLHYATQRYGRGWTSVLGHGHGYDSGGWLMPGATLAINRTGRPEQVLPPSQSGGRQVIVLRVEANSHAYSNFLANEIKRYVRTAGGGDVQVAFG